MLYILATPIGNLDDITLRGKKALEENRLIIAENPNHSRKLLNHFGLKGKVLKQFADHNEEYALPELIGMLLTEDAVLISDAGTPAISDPGFRLVREAIAQGVPVTPLPGPSAAIAALSAAGLPTDKFIFLGFVPKSEIKFTQSIKEAEEIEATIVFYESPHRIVKTLGYLATTWPQARVVVARELTKIHEEFIRGSALEVAEKIDARKNIKGEMTVLVSFK